MSERRGGLAIRAFADLAGWEDWLAVQPQDAEGLWLKIAKAGNAASSLTKSQAIDGALCHGWIDGRIDRYDDDWFLTRFTQRRPKGLWSRRNRDRAEQLIAARRMQPAGAAVIAAAKADGRWAAAYAPASSATEPGDLAIALDANPAARTFFDSLTGANRYAILHRIETAKRADTRAARIARFVAMCAAGETLH